MTVKKLSVLGTARAELAWEKPGSGGGCERGREQGTETGPGAGGAPGNCFILGKPRLLFPFSAVPLAC